MGIISSSNLDRGAPQTKWRPCGPGNRPQVAEANGGAVVVRDPMTRTPWGDSDTLSSRKLPPGTGTPREQVVRSQRERLFGAMVAVSSERGYAATTVADLIALSGVSRSAFYEHFANKDECFVATLERGPRAHCGCRFSAL